MEKHANKIVNLVGTNDLSVLVSPVGSGKTTLLPKLFSDHNAIVYCIQPTEYAVTNIYDYLSKKHGKMIGVELKSKKILHEKNKIIYCDNIFYSLKSLFLLSKLYNQYKYESNSKYYNG